MPKNHLTGQNGQYRKDIHPGLIVDIVLKQDQASGKLTRGIVQDVLSPDDYYRHGIKVRLAMPDVIDIYRVGRVQYIIGKYPFYHAKKYTIGQIGDRLLGYKVTLEQINQIMGYELDIETKDGITILWSNIYSPLKTASPLQTILMDRKLRVDEERPMRDKPRYAIFTIKNNQVIRFEYYQGRERLNLIFDIRRKDLYKPWIDEYLQKEKRE